ncbi:MAG: flagellar export chaperone FliS [Burkholderiales bacterium]|nr:flagellar export chaperone FliS [Burkholderiales bacterium]
MFSAARKAIDVYATVGVETGVASADPHKLILMLYDGTLAAICAARLAISRGEIAAKAAAITKAIAIVDGGLKASLDVKAGGALAERLAALYDYMLNRLLLANLRNDSSLLDEVARLLEELRGAWAEIGQRANAGAPGAAIK